MGCLALITACKGTALLFFVILQVSATFCIIILCILWSLMTSALAIEVMLPKASRPVGLGILGLSSLFVPSTGQS